ncbi:MAG: hypothetical protein ACK4GO_03185 [Gemmobacter sp.]
MSRDSKAQVFIMTLAEMLTDHRAKRTQQLRHQVKAHAERFMRTYRTEFDADLWPTAGALHLQRADSEMAGKGRNG